jgi:hypothetical protein
MKAAGRRIRKEPWAGCNGSLAKASNEEAARVAQVAPHVAKATIVITRRTLAQRQTQTSRIDGAAQRRSNGKCLPRARVMGR